MQPLPGGAVGARPEEGHGRRRAQAAAAPRAPTPRRSPPTAPRTTTPSARVKRLTGARKVQLGGVVTDLDGHGRARQFTPSRLPSLFLTLQRNVECWTTQPLLDRGAAGRASPAPSSSTSSIPATASRSSGSGTFGKLNGYWSGGKRYDARAAALLDEIKAAGRRARGRPRVGVPVPVRRPAAAVGLLARPGHRPAGDGPQRHAAASARRTCSRSRWPASASSRPRRPRACASPAGTGAHYLQYSGLPKLKILNGFIQSLVGLYDFAALTGDPTAQSAVRGRRPRRAARRSPTFDTGAWSLYAAARSRASPTSATTSSCATSSTRCARAPTAVEYCARRAALHRVPDHAAGRCGRSPATLTARKAGQAALQALEDLAGDAHDHARRTSPWPRSRPACSAAGPRRHLDGAEEDRRLRRDA